MKKTKTTARKLAPKKLAAVKGVKVTPKFSAWSLSIYVYWFIIIFFISATFYILGRSHGMMHPAESNVEITEEALMQANEYTNTGKEKLLAGNVNDAISDLTVALESDTPSVETFILRGEAYMQSGDLTRAMDDFNSAINLNTNNSVAFYDRALLYTRLENYPAALSDINNALGARAKNPNDVLQMRDLYAKRGQLNLWMKNWDGAVADYTNSLSQPEGIVNPDVYAERAEAYTAMGKYSDAISDYASAVQVISEQIQGAAVSADTRESLSRRAMGYFEKSSALNLRMDNVNSARSDLKSAHAIAVALADTETVERLNKLIQELH